MSIPTLRTFTGDTNLSGTDMAWNFDTIKTAINGGVASADLSATAEFAPSQVAQNNSIQFISFELHSAPLNRTFFVPYECELYDVSILAKKTDTGTDDTLVSYELKNADGNVLLAVTLDEANDKNGYYNTIPGLPMSPGFYVLTFVGDVGNARFATVRFGVMYKHTKR